MSTEADSPAAAGMDPAENLGGRLRQARLQADLSLREVARQLGVSASFVSQLENGKSQPSVATLFSMARLLGVSIDQLFDRQDQTTPLAADSAQSTVPAEPMPPDEPDDPVATASDKGTEGTEGTPPSRPQMRGFPAETAIGGSSQPQRLFVTTTGQRNRLVLESGVVWEQLVGKSDDLDFIELIYPPGSGSTTDGRMLRHDDYEYGFLLEGALEVTLGFDVFVLHAGEAIGFDSTIPHLFRNPGTTPARGIWVMHHKHQ